MSVEIIADSSHYFHPRLTTMKCRYPRMVHADFMTHRKFSRNARSSRAVPVVTLLQEEIYIPHFLKNKPGMQATEQLSKTDFELARDVWLQMVQACQEGVSQLQKLGVHKQWANRPLEWFGYIDVLVTSTDWSNFFELRDHSDAQPEIRDLAQQMKEALEQSQPTNISDNEWHLPYIWEADKAKYDLPTQLKLSVARCARISYKPFDGNDLLDKELSRYAKLIESKPIHASPTEHQAYPGYCHTHFSKNLDMWIPYRTFVENAWDVYEL